MIILEIDPNKQGESGWRYVKVYSPAIQTQKNKVEGVLALSETPYRSSPPPRYPATNMLSAEPSAAHFSGPSPRRIFLNFARRIFDTNFLDHWLADCLCLLVFKCWCCNHH